LKRRRCCFTVFDPNLMFSLCSATSLGIPFMSEGFHANTSRFALRKSTSALSYLGSSVLTVKIRQPSHEFTFGVGMNFIPYPLVLTPVV
jgi:hypothetical protein